MKPSDSTRNDRSLDHLLAATRFESVRIKEWFGHPGWKLAGRREPTVFFLWLREGRIRWQIGRDRPQVMNAGDLLIAPEQTFVDGWAAGPEDRAPQIAGRLKARVFGGCDLCALLGIRGAYRGDNRISGLIQQMLREHEERPVGWQTSANACVAALLLHLIRSRAAPPDVPRSGMTHFHRLAPAVALLEERYPDTGLRIAELAAAVSLSEVAFRQLCRRALGMKPVELLRRRRTEAAAHLLVSTDLPLKAIADQSGFGDPAFFCRSFRSTTGLTPGAYRKQGREIGQPPRGR